MRRTEKILVGRSDELAVFARVLARTRVEPTAVALVGEPGIGKTQLLLTLREQAHALGFQVFSGRASEFEQGLPFGLVIDALDATFGALDRGALRRIGDERVAELGAVLPSLADAGHRPAFSSERYRLHHAIRVALEALAQEHPVLLALDDLHWADPASIELVSHLLRRRAPRLVLALAYRPRQSSASVLRGIESARREGGLDVIEPRPLSMTEAAELLGSRVDGSALRWLHEESGGVPLYLEELARGAAFERRSDLVAPFDDADVPASVRATIAHELERLSRPAQALARAGAVAGEPFDVELAAEIARLEESEVWSATDELLAADLVRPGPVPRRMQFRHPIVRRATYDAGGAGWRIVAHERAAHILAGRDADLGTLAHHLERSAAPGDELAIETLVQAGRAAVASAPATAARWFATARRLLPHGVDPGRRLELLTELASALGVTGRLPECLDVLAEAHALSPEAGRAPIVAMMARTHRGLGHGEQARSLLAEALDHVASDSREATELTIELAETLPIVGQADAAYDTAQRATAGALVHGDDALLFAATTMLAWAANYRGLIAEAKRHTTQAASIADRLPDEALSTRTLMGLATLVSNETATDRYEIAAAHAERGLRLARETGQLLAVTRLLQGLALVRMMQGRLQRARRHAEEALEASRLLGNDQMLAMASGLLSWTATLQGDIVAALAAGAEGRDAAGRVPRSLAPWLPVVCYGEALIDAGRLEEGREQVRSCGGIHLEEVDVHARTHWVKVLAVAELDAGNVAVATEIIHRLAEDAATFGLKRVAGDERFARAYWLERNGDHDAAASAALEAVELYGACGWVPWEARSRSLAAHCLTAAGDIARATAELERAFASYVAQDAPRRADEAAQALRSLGKRVSRRAAGRDADGALTEREREVAELIADGYTNRQIAAELYLSQKTIEVYVSRLLSKLGVPNRAGIAATVRSAPAR